MTSRLPSGWCLVELGEIVVDGPTNGYSPTSAPDACGTCSLKLSATTQGRLILNNDTIKHLHETIPVNSWAWLEPGDLLVQRSNTAEFVGTAAIYDGPSKAYIYPDLMMRLRFADEATTKWVWRYMNSPTGRHFFSVMAAGAAGSMPKISGAKLKAMPIPLPPLAVQRRIADILDKADAIRRKRKEAIVLTEELLRSTFLEMFGDPVTNPKGWEVKPFGAYLGFVTSGSRGWAEHYTDHGERFIRSLDVQMDRISDEEPAYVMAPSGAEAERTRVREDDVLLTITGSKIGRAARATGAHANAFVSQHVAILRLVPGLDPDVATAFLVSDRGGQVLIARTQYGQTKPGLNLAQIRSFPIPVPPEKVQARIRAARRELRALQERLSGALRSSDDLFACLVQRAFSGNASS